MLLWPLQGPLSQPCEGSRWAQGLGAPVGSIVAGPKPLIARVHRLRRMLGGGMRQVGVLAAPGQYCSY